MGTNLRGDDVQARALSIQVIPIPATQIRILARLETEILAGGLEVPRRSEQLLAPLPRRTQPARIVAIEALQTRGNRREGIEGGEGGVQRQEIGVEAVEEEGVEDLQHNVHAGWVFSFRDLVLAAQPRESWWPRNRSVRFQLGVAVLERLLDLAGLVWID